MNRELLTKLYTESVDYCVAQGPNEDGSNRAWIWEEKFAELIVQECEVALQPILRDMISRGKAVELIREHFGVK